MPSLFFRPSGEGDGTPLQYSCLENPMDGGAWWAAVHGVAKSRARLSDFTFTFLFHALEKEMATHSNILAWRIPRTEEPSGLPSMGSRRVGHDWSDLAAAAAAITTVVFVAVNLVAHGHFWCQLSSVARWWLERTLRPDFLGPDPQTQPLTECVTLGNKCHLPVPQAAELCKGLALS